ncbi:hypothetical protein [Flagellimonas halotolerans]|uniref:FERM domain-containing protein n=1 Tax=Flagellimonas halotolerans TaxID=3112164 RepID=A0ABU6IPX7_9FLAO|nr:MULTISPECIES: hypothetical protein [unclassified Allomuricauda]MEC3965303.1 hypothetical protein [Muricauda sp. SYSU M86414]MEC4265169.1 hypothetical protein [Muricauda sp. SYSU M84420]
MNKKSIAYFPYIEQEDDEIADELWHNSKDRLKKLTEKRSPMYLLMVKFLFFPQWKYYRKTADERSESSLTSDLMKDLLRVP